MQANDCLWKQNLCRQICGTYKQLSMLKCPLMLSYGTKLLLIKEQLQKMNIPPALQLYPSFHNSLSLNPGSMFVWVSFAPKNGSVCVKPWQKSFWNYTCTVWPHVRGFEKHLLDVPAHHSFASRPIREINPVPRWSSRANSPTRMKMAYCARWASSMSDRKCCECWVKESCCRWTFSVGVQVMETGHCRAAETASYYFPPSTWAVCPCRPSVPVWAAWVRNSRKPKRSKSVKWIRGACPEREGKLQHHLRSSWRRRKGGGDAVGGRLEIIPSCLSRGRRDKWRNGMLPWWWWWWWWCSSRSDALTEGRSHIISSNPLFQTKSDGNLL